MLLYSLLAALMSATWGWLWIHLSRHPELLNEETEPGWACAQLPRPLTGVILYALGGLATWFISPVIGLLSIVAMIVYRAFTSEGVRPRG